MLLAIMTLPAIWHDWSFPDDPDGEYPAVVRPTFSAHPPPAYRLAEPGDTIDRIAIYISSIAVVLSISGAIFDPGARRRWLASIAISLAALWFAATPGPTYDGWHGLGFQTIANASAPVMLRLVLLAALIGLIGLLGYCLGVSPREWQVRWTTARQRGVAGLLVVASILTISRLTEFPDFEPYGYWPRWAFVWALVAYSAAILRLLPRPTQKRPLRISLASACNLVAWYGLVWAGIWLTWYHRPLERLRAVVPGRIYMSAMPTARGLEIAQARHHFKTIINLFPEDTPQRSPRLGDELRFVRENGLNYVQSPSDVTSSNAFLDKTLALAQDPDAWPILVHCHGCMDRTPAWVGIYKFVIQGEPLVDIMTFIERHRGYRPKASVTLLYNRVLPRLAPERADRDPIAALLLRNAEGTEDPYDAELAAELARSAEDAANPSPAAVSDGRRPSLTPRR
jgi:hypothetical protein